VDVDVHPLLDRAWLGHPVDPHGVLGDAVDQDELALVARPRPQPEGRGPELDRAGRVDGIQTQVLESGLGHSADDSGLPLGA